VRQELEAWGQQQAALPLLAEKPGRTQREKPRQWHGQSVNRQVDVEYSDGRVSQEALRFVVVHSSQLAQQQIHTYAVAQAKEAEALADHVQRVEAPYFACMADAKAAITDYEGRGQGRRGRRPRPWRYHAAHYRVVTETRRTRRARRGRPPKTDPLPVETCYRIVGEVAALPQAEADNGWTVLATTLRPEVCSDAVILHAYHEQHTTVEPGFRWIKNPAAISPVWLEKSERIAALAMLTVMGLLVYTLIQRQVRLYLHIHSEQVPGNKGATALPTAAVVFALFSPVTRVRVRMGRKNVYQMYGVHRHHWLVCEALGLDHAWDATPITQRNVARGHIP
jgi:hypothetical protein